MSAGSTGSAARLAVAALGALGALAALVPLGACPGRTQPTIVQPGEINAINERDQRARIRAELEDQILTSYERDETPDVETSMIDPRVGPAWIGVGPDDVLVGPELVGLELVGPELGGKRRVSSRWPLEVDSRTWTEARSKRLEVHLAQDGTAAWAFDEISWRVHLCGRTAAIPLRLTALFAREGDRWVFVFEHLSFGRVPAPARDGSLRGAQMKSAVASPDLVDELSGVLAQAQFRAARSEAAMSTGPEATILGIDVTDEWHSVDVLASNLAGLSLRAEDRRVGTIGSPGTVAYWVGNFIATLPARPGIAAGKARVRGTFIFERRRTVKADERERSCSDKPEECRWVLVQGHVSQPIDDGPDAAGERYDIVDLTSLVFGTALVSPKPLAITCDDGSVKAPAAPSRPRPAGGSR
ncbi:MAG TPA: nuclear transport factor 2 family protein [Kofleriaceae bacterium]|nr:nuclear transport factor 2 family protein [Kofleriaceae bacterium]